MKEKDEDKYLKKNDSMQDEDEYNLKEYSAKYNERVSRNINKLMNDQDFINNDYIESGMKRNKSADMNSSQKNNENKKEPTYIQKLLGLNRTDS